MIRTKSVRAIEHPIRSGFLTAAPSTGEGAQILFLGAIEERKGIWDALAAFHVAASPDWKLAIVGNGLEDQVAKLRRLVSEKGLAARVVHYPQLSTPEIVALMQNSSVFLLPTRIDTGPTALKEALAMGLWPVCYDNSGPAHYVRRFRYGNLAEDLNCVALTETLKAALAARDWKKLEQRTKIENLIRPLFDRANIWRELGKFYGEIAAGKAGR
jgi:glycosyltransferase involved in cell wall biosynthesis